MLSPFIRKYSDRFLSKWLVLLFDSFVVSLALPFAYLLGFNLDFSQAFVSFHWSVAGITLGIYFLSFLLFRSHTGIIRFTGLEDAFRVFKATLAALFVLILGRIGTASEANAYLLFPRLAVIGIHFLITLFALIGSRFVIRSTYTLLMRNERKKKLKVIIYGAGAAGMITRTALLKDRFVHFDIDCFIDDNPSKKNKRLEGVPVWAPLKVLNRKYVKQQQVQQMILAIQDINIERKKQIIERGLELGLQVKVVPPIDNWINGQLSASQLRKVNIEELLERDPIQLNNQNIKREVHGKVVLVTGAAGSIGSEISRQILQYDVEKLILLDQAESPLYELQFELKSHRPYSEFYEKVDFVLADVNDVSRMKRIFKNFRPDIVYHAAAYKHVPLMEDHPYEALRVNVNGTRLLADLSLHFRVKKFVMISTDKAVNPTNVMGASKRIAEMYIQQLSNGKTQFITTRFGNVLGSNGSVIPLFRKQIEEGGPLTITHKDIIRYFMTIPEACNLVLEAGAMGQGGEIFVFDMGSPVRIYDLAQKMIQLSGFKVGKDIEIQEIGLRPGEKLYEELLADQENTLATHHPKILKARTRIYDKETLVKTLNELSSIIRNQDDFQLVKKMKEIVPEFKSNNSVFEELDTVLVGVGRKR